MPQGRLYFQAVQSPAQITIVNEYSSLPKIWPTPTARDGKGGYPWRQNGTARFTWDTLDVAVQHTDDKTPAQLNPEFAEYLMGYPLGSARVATGIKQRTARLKGLSNAVRQ